MSSPTTPRPRLGRRIALSLLGGFALGGAASLLYGATIETRRFQVRHETIPLLPESAAVDRFRILHISDLHLVPTHNTAKVEFTRSLAELEPDLVVNTGDNLGAAGSETFELLLHALDPLLDVPGVFVPGSNDFFAPTPLINPFKYFFGPSHTPQDQAQISEAGSTDDQIIQATALAENRTVLEYQELFAEFTHRGWQDLTDQSAILEVSGLTLNTAGTNDPHLALDTWPGFEPVDADLRLALTHAPYQRVLTQISNSGADLILAGHTHGGQVCLPGVGALVTNCDLPRDRAAGLFPWGTTRQSYVNVSAGLGAAPAMPVRFANPPEAVVLDVVKDNH